MEGDALYIEGIGYIGQYYSYLETLWEKGVPYFVRDMYFNELESKLNSGATSKEMRTIVNRVNFLNSKIRAYEDACRKATCGP